METILADIQPRGPGHQGAKALEVPWGGFSPPWNGGTGVIHSQVMGKPAQEPQKVILAKAGDLVFSCDFAHLEEVTGLDRMMDRRTLPEGLVAGDPARSWVSSRGSWFPVREVLPEFRPPKSSDQLLLVRTSSHRAALRVEHVVGFEQLPPIIPVSRLVRKNCGLPLAGFRLRRGGVVLELDLSRMIE